MEMYRPSHLAVESSVANTAKAPSIKRMPDSAEWPLLALPDMMVRS